MSISTARLGLAALVIASTAATAQEPQRFGFGTTPSQQELSQFTSVLPDGRGLPPGSGSAADGRTIYAAQCTSCHGDDLQGGVGDKLIGGRGTLPGDSPEKAPVKTVESYWPYATTLFDYIKRAMPLTSPGSLTNDQVYAVSAYILSRANIVPTDAMLDAKSLASIHMPNRNGFIPDPRPETFPPAQPIAVGHSAPTQ
jgi:S-disulfanyl-L-cysteine oxidoreductase SoxD